MKCISVKALGSSFEHLHVSAMGVVSVSLVKLLLALSLCLSGWFYFVVNSSSGREAQVTEAVVAEAVPTWGFFIESNLLQINTSFWSSC